MAYKVTSRNGYHYLGNNNPSGDKEVHNLHNEKTNCQINEIFNHNHAVAFNPDSHSQAKAEGYDNCAHCIGNSTR